MAVLYVRIPQAWNTRLKLMADGRAISVSSLVRIFLRDALFGGEEAA